MASSSGYELPDNEVNRFLVECALPFLLRNPNCLEQLSWRAAQQDNASLFAFMRGLHVHEFLWLIRRIIEEGTDVERISAFDFALVIIEIMYFDASRQLREMWSRQRFPYDSIVTEAAELLTLREKMALGEFRQRILLSPWDSFPARVIQFWRGTINPLLPPGAFHVGFKFIEDWRTAEWLIAKLQSGCS